eukprot:TRINITY_DN55140_c0_g1_i1.p1 TRINITY_DN55140_c0_g1~~TRINITY_DN55140_c0_g1_i1.p1  ORF type:complete len:494 (-),score=64.85 TRINITY_DN55140_c0_g1_i1:87-1535(-)
MSNVYQHQPYAIVTVPYHAIVQQSEPSQLQPIHVMNDENTCINRCWPLPNPQPAAPMQQQRVRGKGGKNKKKKKPRTEIPHGDNSNPICLDHLKGICPKKRWRCKYAHPPLWLLPTAPTNSSRQICTVFILTGTCKYGDRCYGIHPAMDHDADHPPVCLPANANNNKAAALAELNSSALHSLSSSSGSSDSSSSCSEADSSSSSNALSEEDTSSVGSATSSPTHELSTTDGPSNSSSSFSSRSSVSHSSSPHAPPPQPQRGGDSCAVRKAMGLFNKVTETSFDSILLQLFNLLNSPTPDENNLTLQQVVPLVFGKAVVEADPLRRLYARLCKNLYDLVPPTQQPLFYDQLCSLITQLLSQDISCITDPVQASHVKSRMVGACAFMGHLFEVGLLQGSEVCQCVSELTERSTFSGSVGELGVELVCTLLSVVGKSFHHSQQPQHQQLLTYSLATVGLIVTQHSFRSQVLFANLKDRQRTGWMQ